MATWRNGYAEDCKSFYPSSILSVASKIWMFMDKRILKIASDTNNVSFLKNHTHRSKLKNSMCGDVINIYLVIKKNKIIKFKFNGDNCIYCQASASLLSKVVIKKNISKINKLLKEANNCFKTKKIIIDGEWKDYLKIMNKDNAFKRECLLLPLKATLKAIKN